MKISSFFYGIKQGIKGIVQNRMFSLASIGTITACLFLFGIFYFLTSNFRFMIKNAESGIGITVFFDEEADDQLIEEIGNDILACKDVKNIEFVSAEEAWNTFSKDVFQGDETVTNTFEGDNPLEGSASYNVYLERITNQHEIVKYIEDIEGVRQVNSSASVAKNLNSFNVLIAYISVSVILILLAVAVFLISTTIAMGISVRKKEISIMKLMGATDLFIRMPFVIEGVLIGMIGALLPLGLLYILYENVTFYVMERFQVLENWLTFIDISSEFRVLVPLALYIGIGIGLFGSIFTVRKHLRNI